MASDSLYLSMFMVSPVPAVLLVPENRSFKIVKINEAYRKASGVSEEKVVGREFSELLSKTIFLNHTDEIISSLQNVKTGPLKLETGEINPTAWKVENALVKDPQAEKDYIVHHLTRIDENCSSETTEQLLEQHEYYRSLFTYHPDGIYSLDLQGRVKSVNTALAKMANLKPEDLHNVHYDAFILPEDYDRVNEHFRKASSGEIQQFDCNVKTPEGEIKILNITNVPINIREKTIGVFGIARDVTEQRFNEKARIIQEKALRNFNKKMYGILESISDGFFTVGKDSKVTFWNKEAERILKFPRESILGKKLWDVFSHLISSKFYSGYVEAIQGNKAVYFDEFYPDLELWLQVSVYPSDEGLSVYFRDITERKNSDEQIRISNERFNYLSKVTNDAVWDWDVEKSIVHRSSGFHDLFGIDINDETFNTPEHWFSRLHPEDTDRVKNSFLKAQKSSADGMWMEEYRYKKADGTFAIISDRCMLIRNNQGKVIRMIGAMRDISDQKNSENALNLLNDELQVRAEQLAMSNSELEKFAYVASHDLKEPLRMITGFLQILEKKYGPSLDETANMYIDHALKGSSRMQRLIKDLLDYSRISQPDTKMEAIDLNEIMADVRLNLLKQIEENDAEIIINGTLPTIDARRTSITRLFQNLINNAIKFKKPDEPPVITISVKGEKKHWLFSIKDNGIGMSEENFSRIFEIFSRLHAQDDYPGSGIGLAICKKIVKQHAGAIWVKSQENHGSNFYFTLQKYQNNI